MSTVTNAWLNPSAETNTTGYSVITGTSGVAAITRPTTGGKAGAAFVRSTWSVASTAAGGGVQYANVAVVAGQVRSFGVFVRPSITNRLRLDVEWRTASTSLSTSSGAVKVVLAGPDWADAPRLTLENAVVPATATVARIKVISVAGASYADWSAASYLDLDAGMAVQSEMLPPYDDPTTSQLWQWSGTAHASASIWYQGAVGITEYPDENPTPRVEILITDLAPAVKFYTVHRQADGRDFEMRGAVEAAVAGASTRIDFEIPFNVPVTYRARMFDQDMNDLGFTPSASVTFEVEGTYIHNPLDPEGAMRVELLDGTGAEVSRPIEGEAVWPIGRSVAVILTTQRRGVVGYPLFVETLTIDDRTKLQAMLGGYERRMVPVLCVRTSEPVDVPRPFFIGVLNPKTTTINPLTGATVVDHDLSGDEAAPPAPGLFIPLLTRADLNAYYGTRAALNAGNLTRLQANRRYELAGTV